ncbi:MAG: RDD family protein [Planctomycetota bacterium]|jgi:hypothetical protein
MSKMYHEPGPARYAGLWIRGAALLLDWLVFCAAFFPITKVVKGVWLMGPSDHRWVSGSFISDPLCLCFLIVIIAYFVLLEGFFGATIGKGIVYGGTERGQERAASRRQPAGPERGRYCPDPDVTRKSPVRRPRGPNKGHSCPWSRGRVMNGSQGRQQRNLPGMGQADLRRPIVRADTLCS